MCSCQLSYFSAKCLHSAQALGQQLQHTLAGCCACVSGFGRQQAVSGTCWENLAEQDICLHGTMKNPCAAWWIFLVFDLI